MDLDSIGSYLFVAAVASYLTYVLSVRVTRRGKLYDAKLKAYGEVVGLYQEALISLGKVIELQAMDLSDKDKTVANAMTVLGELVHAGDIETLAIACDPQKAAEDISIKGDLEYIESLRNRAMMLNTTSMMKNLIAVRYRGAQLALVSPPKEVYSCIERVNQEIASGGATVLIQALKSYPEVFSQIDIVNELKGLPKDKKKWMDGVETTLTDLVRVTLADINKTL